MSFWFQMRVHTDMHTQTHTWISIGLQDIGCFQKVYIGASLGALRGPEAVDHNSIHFCSFLEYKLQVSLCDRAVPGSRRWSIDLLFVYKIHSIYEQRHEAKEKYMHTYTVGTLNWVAN